jgi:hypothetical protein
MAGLDVPASVEEARRLVGMVGPLLTTGFLVGVITDLVVVLGGA